MLSDKGEATVRERIGTAADACVESTAADGERGPCAHESGMPTGFPRIDLSDPQLAVTWE